MNQFKEDLNQELKSLTIATEKKQLIVNKVKTKLHREKRRVHWQYRFVLTTFTIFAFGFGYLLWQQDDSNEKKLGATELEPGMTTNWSILNNDLSKAILLITIFIILYSLIKRSLNKRRKGLPVCANCGEEWTYKKSLKVSMTNKEVLCPHCHQKQYRTKKSSMNATKLNFLIPFIVIVPQIFENIFLSIFLFIFCTAFVILRLSPYMIELQNDDSSKDPLW